MVLGLYCGFQEDGTLDVRAPLNRLNLHSIVTRMKEEGKEEC